MAVRGRGTERGRLGTGSFRIRGIGVSGEQVSELKVDRVIRDLEFEGRTVEGCERWRTFERKQNEVDIISLELRIRRHELKLLKN